MRPMRKLLVVIFAILMLISIISHYREDSIEAPQLSYESAIEKYRPSSYKTMKFGTHLDFASYSNGFAYPSDAIMEELKVAEDVGVDIIRLDMSFDAWLYFENPEKRFYFPANDQLIRENMGDMGLREYSKNRIKVFDELAEKIKADGKELMIADAAAEQYWGNPMEWDEFTVAYLARVRTLAERYQPEYYVVVKEPSWYMGKWGTSMSIPVKVGTAEWLELTRRLCKTVKTASPNTKCAVAISMDGYEDSTFSKTEYIIGASRISEVDVLGFDVYNEKEFGDLDLILPEISGKGKELWILETWTSGYGSTGRWWMSKADAEWIKASVYYAQMRELDGYVTFYTQHFFLYDGDYDLERISKYADEKTPAYYAYVEVIKEVRSEAE